MADPTKSASTSVTVTTGIIVSVYASGWKQLASTAFIQVNATVDLSALVTNDPANAGVTWSVAGCVGGASSCGSFVNINSSNYSTAQFVAPDTVPPGGHVSVVATSVTDPTKSASLPVTISPISFISQDYSVGSSPTGITVADLNHDGNLDVVVSDSGNLRERW